MAASIKLTNKDTGRTFRLEVRMSKSKLGAKTTRPMVFRGKKGVSWEDLVTIIHYQLEKGERRRLRKWLRGHGFTTLAAI